MPISEPHTTSLVMPLFRQEQAQAAEDLAAGSTIHSTFSARYLAAWPAKALEASSTSYLEPAQVHETAADGNAGRTSATIYKSLWRRQRSEQSEKSKSSSTKLAHVVMPPAPKLARKRLLAQLVTGAVKSSLHGDFSKSHKPVLAAEVPGKSSNVLAGSVTAKGEWKNAPGSSSRFRGASMTGQSSGQCGTEKQAFAVAS